MPWGARPHTPTRTHTHTRAHAACSAAGDVCGETIKKGWGPSKNTIDLAALIVDFLKAPNMESPYDAECAMLVSTDVDKYEVEARKLAATLPKKA